MAIKVETKSSCHRDYPKLMKSKETGQIVLFIRMGAGTTLVKGDSQYSIGYFSDLRAMASYQDYNEPLTLSND